MRTKTMFLKRLSVRERREASSSSMLILYWLTWMQLYRNGFRKQLNAVIKIWWQHGTDRPSFPLTMGLPMWERGLEAGNSSTSFHLKGLNVETCSQWFTAVKPGGPQGSVLDPFVFLCTFRLPPAASFHFNVVGADSIRLYELSTGF